MKIFTIDKNDERFLEEQFEAEKKIVEFTAYLSNGKRKKVFGVLEWDNHKIFLDGDFDVSYMIAITDKKHNTYSIKEIKTKGSEFLFKKKDKQNYSIPMHEIDFDFCKVW